MTHRHDWHLASPIDPGFDKGNAAARICHDYGKTAHYACDCGAVKMELWTNGHVNRNVTRANGRLWRGRKRIAGRRRYGSLRRDALRV